MNEGNETITERRRKTRNKMYRYIYDSRTPVSKQQLAKEMGYSLPTVQQNIAELLSAGLIRPGEIQKLTGGRPAVGYTVEERIRYSVGISVSSTSLRMLITNILQDQLAYKTVGIRSSRRIGSADRSRMSWRYSLRNRRSHPKSCWVSG